jgi:outer membrane murein-binding lipoprotein Lpp
MRRLFRAIAYGAGCAFLAACATTGSVDQASAKVKELEKKTEDLSRAMDKVADQLKDATKEAQKAVKKADEVAKKAGVKLPAGGEE